jgi:hypothetical protein
MPSSQSSELTTREKIQYGLIGLAVLGGAAFLINNLIKKSKSNLEERFTLEDGSAATFAKQLKMAFENDGWMGTDEEAIRQVLRKVASKEDFQKVIESYQRLYSNSLLRDMKDELSSSEYAEMIAIISSKPDRYDKSVQSQGITAFQRVSWARRLKAAFDYFPGTDEDAIRAVFLEIPTQTDFQQVANSYRSEYGIDLVSDLKSELEFWEYAPMMKLITDKPK